MLILVGRCLSTQGRRAGPGSPHTPEVPSGPARDLSGPPAAAKATQQKAAPRAAAKAAPAKPEAAPEAADAPQPEAAAAGDSRKAADGPQVPQSRMATRAPDPGNVRERLRRKVKESTANIYTCTPVIQNTV